MIDSPVLVLNQNYEPLNVCRARRAIVLLYGGRAEMLENGTGFIQAVNYTVPLPSVIRLAHLIRRPPHQPKLTRVEVFHRDRYTCQYCGKETRQLTLDHVIPRYRGGQHVWNNVVSACIGCNRRKAGRTPEEAGMILSHRPVVPHHRFPFLAPYRHQTRIQEWHKYLPQDSGPS